MLGPISLLPPFFTCSPTYYLPLLAHLPTTYPPLQGHGRAAGGAAVLQQAPRHRRAGERLVVIPAHAPTQPTQPNTILTMAGARRGQGAILTMALLLWLYLLTDYGRSATRPRRCCVTFARSRPPRATGSRPPRNERGVLGSSGGVQCWVVVVGVSTRRAVCKARTWYSGAVCKAPHAVCKARPTCGG